MSDNKLAKTVIDAAITGLAAGIGSTPYLRPVGKNEKCSSLV